MSGMQPVHDLADYLLQLRDCRTLTRTQQGQLAVFWDKLEPHDQRPAVFQPRTRSSSKGRFMASKMVMEDPRVSALTGIQLLPLNQATLILW